MPNYTLLPLFCAAIFFTSLFAALTLARPIGWILFGVSAALYVIAVWLDLNFLRSPEYDFHAPNYGLLLLSAMFLALLLARPLFKWRAGKLILGLRPSKSASGLLVVAALVFFGMALFALLPAERRVADNRPVIDEYYLASRGPLFLFMLLMGFYYLSTGLQRLEMRQQGVIVDNVLWNWGQFESHSWREISNNISDVELVFKLKSKAIFRKQIKLVVPYSARQSVEDLLAKVEDQS